LFCYVKRKINTFAGLAAVQDAFITFDLTREQSQSKRNEKQVRCTSNGLSPEQAPSKGLFLNFTQALKSLRRTMLSDLQGK
jgi:hypothetical protein